MDAPRRSPRWSATAKLVVALVIIAFAGLVLFRFSEVIPPLVIAVMFAFILNPPVTFIAGRLKISRALAVGIIYVALLLALAGLSTALGFAIRRQIVQLDANVDIRKVIADVPRQVDSLVHGQTVVGPITPRSAGRCSSSSSVSTCCLTRRSWVSHFTISPFRATRRTSSGFSRSST
ncbi:MAG: AI-2E family transporter [Chloroflexi bacterium]|nr:AI-2E family transporter [Chloroflexota bacterium]